MHELKYIGIVGCGSYGCGIARIAALAGYQVHICESSQDTLDSAFAGSLRFFKRQAARGTISEYEIHEAACRIHGTVNVENLECCELVIEDVSENFTEKAEMLRTLDVVCPPNTILAPHTSSLSVTQLAAGIQRPHNVIGVHFFLPVHLVKLVEIIQTPLLDRHTSIRTQKFIRSLRKDPILVMDSAGFVVTRLLIAYFFHAIRIFEDGVATKRDIDKAMELGAGYPKGPFALMDTIGLDHINSIAQNLLEAHQDIQFTPPLLLQRLIENGHLGRKSGRGFYKYHDTRE